VTAAGTLVPTLAHQGQALPELGGQLAQGPPLGRRSRWRRAGGQGSVWRGTGGHGTGRRALILGTASPSTRPHASHRQPPPAGSPAMLI
jgi:hypothetical protein